MDGNKNEFKINLKKLEKKSLEKIRNKRKSDNFNKIDEKERNKSRGEFILDEDYNILSRNFNTQKFLKR